jgi:glycosyltransferase involved in cell wall biosynthesis
MKIAILTNAIPNYRLPILKKLSCTNGLEVKVFISLPLNYSCNDAAKDLNISHSKGINLPFITHFSKIDKKYIEWVNIPLLLPIDLIRYKADIYISGEFGLRSLVTLAISHIRRKPLIIWSEETEERSKAISKLQALLRKTLIPKVDAFLAWGKPAVEYLKLWNIPNNKIYYCAQAIDNEQWLKSCKKIDKEAEKIVLGVRGTVFLTVGRLIESKGINYLIDAWCSLSNDLKATNTLIIVGSGSYEQELKALANKDSSANILFTGHLSYEKIRNIYAASDVFVFPSFVDVWGLVVNEAMICGLPVLSSKYTGAGRELITSEKYGEIFDPIDVESLKNLLIVWKDKSKGINKQIIQNKIMQLNFDVSIRAFQSAINDVYR